MNGNLLFKKTLNKDSSEYIGESGSNKTYALKYMQHNPYEPIGTVAQTLNIHPEYLRTWIKEQE